MENSKISWTNHTFNPWIGCTKVSPGCERCYAEAQDHRWGHDRWGKGKERTKTSAAIWAKPLAWNKRAEEIGDTRYRVFCASLADIFDEEVPDEWRDDLFKVIKKTPFLDWQLLTKRPEKMREYMTKNYSEPLPNVWLGVTAEDQQRLDERLPILLSTPALIHWLSIEPQIGPIVLPQLDSHVDWAIAGGESGHGARQFDLRWARDLRDQCKRAGISFFLKQLGCNWNDFDQKHETTSAHNKWDKPEEWPADLQVQEFPA